MSFFYPQLTLGVDALSESRRREVGDFLVEVVRQRGFPLHVASLWNALYFRWNLQERRYVAATIEPSRIPCRRMHERDEYLPVGAFVRVETRTQAGDLWGEVIYKEGAHPEVTADHLPPGLCGNPGEVVELDGRRVVILRERFVLDIGAFGPEQNAITPAAYERLLRRARWIDARGHLVMEAVYPSEDAQLEDVDLYINYLLNHHRDGLLAFCFREAPSEEELREALIRSFAAVRDLALARPELCSWRQKLFFDRDRYREQVADQGPLPLGAADLGYLLSCLGRPPRGRRVGYVAIGPRLDDLFSQGGYDDEERARMRGPAYAEAVAYTNTFIAERLAAEAQNGLLNGDLNLRLDDDWQAGGIWRCERLDGPSSITLLPPTLPLHLGLVEAHGRGEAEPAEDSGPDAVTVHGFTVALTGRDIAAGRLRLPDRIVNQLPASGSVTLRLRHNGDAGDHAVVLDRGATALTGAPWPPSFYPGIRLYGNVERGGSVVKVRTQPLVTPLVIDGVELRYETVEGVYRRETGEPRMSASERRGASTLNELISRAFRRYGRDVGEGGKALTYRELLRAVLGPAARASESQALAEALEALGLGRHGADYIWRPRLTRRTAVSDRSVLAAYGEAQRGRGLRRKVRRHYVPMYLRHMVQRGVGDEKIATYAEARIAHGMQGLLPLELPEGYTWVIGHERGGDDEPGDDASVNGADGHDQDREQENLFEPADVGDS